MKIIFAIACVIFGLWAIIALEDAELIFWVGSVVFAVLVGAASNDRRP